MAEKTLTEKDTRKGLFEHARRIGAVADLQNLFDKWDRLIALAPPGEKFDMTCMAVLEIYQLLDISPEEQGLTIDNKVVVPAKPTEG